MTYLFENLLLRNDQHPSINNYSDKSLYNCVGGGTMYNCKFREPCMLTLTTLMQDLDLCPLPFFLAITFSNALNNVRLLRTSVS